MRRWAVRHNFPNWYYRFHLLSVHTVCSTGLDMMHVNLNQSSMIGHSTRTRNSVSTSPDSQYMFSLYSDFISVIFDQFCELTRARRRLCIVYAFKSNCVGLLKMCRFPQESLNTYKESYTTRNPVKNYNVMIYHFHVMNFKIFLMYLDSHICF